MTNQALYDKIVATDLISHGDMFFKNKLQFKHHWSVEMTNELYIEYKKFLYLATMGAVIPPPLIDLVWHEHILFTKEYDRLTEITGTKLHHYPDVPGAYITDQTHWRETLDRYVAEFGYTKVFQKYWLGMNAWQRFRADREMQRRTQRKTTTSSGAGTSNNSSSGCSSGVMVVPIFCSSSDTNTSTSHCSSGTSHCSSGTSGCSSSSCGSGCGGGCGGG